MICNETKTKMYTSTRHICLEDIIYIIKGGFRLYIQILKRLGVRTIAPPTLIPWFVNSFLMHKSSAFW